MERELLMSKDLHENMNIMFGLNQEKSFLFLSLIVRFSDC